MRRRRDGEVGEVREEVGEMGDIRSWVRGGGRRQRQTAAAADGELKAYEREVEGRLRRGC